MYSNPHFQKMTMPEQLIALFLRDHKGTVKTQRDISAHLSISSRTVIRCLKNPAFSKLAKGDFLSLPGDIEVTQSHYVTESHVTESHIDQPKVTESHIKQGDRESHVTESHQVEMPIPPGEPDDFGEVTESHTTSAIEYKSKGEEKEGKKERKKDSTRWSAVKVREIYDRMLKAKFPTVKISATCAPNKGFVAGIIKTKCEDEPDRESYLESLLKLAFDATFWPFDETMANGGLKPDNFRLESINRHWESLTAALGGAVIADPKTMSLDERIRKGVA